jgi:hypothetical protein
VKGYPTKYIIVKKAFPESPRDLSPDAPVIYLNLISPDVPFQNDRLPGPLAFRVDA